MKLDIFIITYNRSALLKQTLGVFSKSVFANFPIKVLNNRSTEDTLQVAQSFVPAMPNLQIITNKVNIGGDANILRAIELSDGEYTWVVCDDDDINLEALNALADIMDNTTADLIHVGAHKYNWEKFAGKLDTPRNLVAAGYPYFKFASFIPCTIFKTAAFRGAVLIAGYRNIVNSYPHMPCFFNALEDDKLLYIVPKQVVTASEGSLNYSADALHYWWLNTCKLLKDKAEVRLAFLDQFRNIHAEDRGDGHGLIMLKILIVKEPKGGNAHRFLDTYFTSADKAFIRKRIVSDWIYYNITNPLRAIKKSLTNTAGKTAPAGKSNMV
ncbi:glycosyltransferase family 2 protein [Mucilaginibacter pedocola]|uniref:Glycosyltransferase 2-like domain-containing protein n=1 Tax=Mucilaginibacter pedocola TaxID=1792845 RepID=A0A1S9P7Y6_9SPHI|nr:glycosyltransferase [Mucilaginibacter pedocola]OOQ57065.1 hypothetical protein BC343_16165 [Mucilaginibacter pedocola]